MIYTLPAGVGRRVRARAVLQRAHTVITFKSCTVSLNCSPVCKARPANRSMAMQLSSALEVVNMGTAFRRPFVRKAFPVRFCHPGVCMCMCTCNLWHHILSVLRCGYFSHWETGHVLHSMASDRRGRAVGVTAHRCMHLALVMDTDVASTK